MVLLWLLQTYYKDIEIHNYIITTSIFIIIIIRKTFIIELIKRYNWVTKIVECTTHCNRVVLFTLFLVIKFGFPSPCFVIWLRCLKFLFNAHHCLTVCFTEGLKVKLSSLMPFLAVLREMFLSEETRRMDYCGIQDFFRGDKWWKGYVVNESKASSF